MMVPNICDGFSLNLGSLDLVAAASSKGPDVGTILNSAGIARSTPGTASVSDTWPLQRPSTDFPLRQLIARSPGPWRSRRPRGQHNDARWRVPRLPEGVEGFRRP